MHFFVIFFEKIPPACLDGNPPPFTREAMAQMTEGLKVTLILFKFHMLPRNPSGLP